VIHVLRIVIDSLILLAFFAVSVSALSAWLGFAGDLLAWRRYLTQAEGWPKWPSGRPAVQAAGWRRLIGPAEEADREAEQHRQGARTSLGTYYAKGVLMVALIGLFALADTLMRALGG
jgi:hypothetical protein